MSALLRAPFPWFGGKRRVAAQVWEALDVGSPNYIEPFFGSGAVLLSRPGGAGKIETINDRDRMVANFWRAICADPWAVAEWADGPVNEADLHARHVWLVEQLATGSSFLERMHQDPHYSDPKIAGWWVWGLCCWIGSGWCVEPQNHKVPELAGAGKGVHSGKARNVRARPLPSLRVDSGAAGMGIHASALSRKLPMLAVKADGACAGRGIHATQPGTFMHAINELNRPDAPPCFEWFEALMLRLRYVRVACGDWSRVLGDSVLGKGQGVGGRRHCAVFLDPPYSQELRDPGLYAEDAPAISAQVRQWAIEHGDDLELRIALCGYEGEHEMPSNWSELAWKGARGYAAEDNENRDKERIWFSPGCRIKTRSAQLSLL